jgi:purine-cytosine permease-like protein
MVFALYGHGAVVALQKAIVPLVGLAMVAGVFAFAPGFHADHHGGGYVLGSFWATWMLSAVVAASGPISYAPSLGDYTHRISRRHSDRRLLAAATIGVFGGLLVTALFGMFTAVTFTNPTDSHVLDLVRGAPMWFVLPILVIGLAGSVGQGR